MTPDEALKITATFVSVEPGSNVAVVLRDEVLELRAKLARVEALPKYWRDTSGDRSRAWECAEDLEAALREPQL